MSETLFAAEVMNQTIDLVTKGLRDLRSASLRPFYAQPEPVSSNYVTGAYDAVRAEMDDADLTPPTKPEFSEQLAEGGSQVFIQFMRDSGIVPTEDFTTSSWWRMKTPSRILAAYPTSCLSSGKRGWLRSIWMLCDRWQTS